MHVYIPTVAQLVMLGIIAAAIHDAFTRLCNWLFSDETPGEEK